MNKLRGYFLKMIENPIEEKFYNNYELEERIDFDTGFIQLLRGTVGVLAKDDLFIKNAVFKSLKSIDKKIRERRMRGLNGVYQLTYQYFRDVFLEIEHSENGQYKEYREGGKRQFKVLGIRPLPELNLALNFLHPPITLQSNEEQEVATL